MQFVLSTARVETLPEVRDELLKVLPSHIAGLRGVHVVIRHTRNAVQRRCVEQHAEVHQGRREEVGATVDIQQTQTDIVRAHRGRRDDRESKTKHCQDRDHTEVQLMVVLRVSNVFTDLGIPNRAHCRHDQDNLRRNLHQGTGCAVNQFKPKRLRTQNLSRPGVLTRSQFISKKPLRVPDPLVYYVYVATIKNPSPDQETQ